MAGHGSAEHGGTRYGEATPQPLGNWRLKCVLTRHRTRHGMSWRCMARSGGARFGGARLHHDLRETGGRSVSLKEDAARRDVERRGKVRLGPARQGYTTQPVKMGCEVCPSGKSGRKAKLSGRTESTRESPVLLDCWTENIQLGRRRACIRLSSKPYVLNPSAPGTGS